MPIYIEMPKLSDTMTEGTVVKWLKQPGDQVQMGEVIAEVETDKATMEMEAFDDGNLHKLYVDEGGKAAVGDRIALLLEDGEEPPSEEEEKQAEAKGGKDAGRKEKASETQEDSGDKKDKDSDRDKPKGDAKDGKADRKGSASGETKSAKPSAPAKTPAPVRPADGSGRVKASPLARKIAETEGIDLSRIQGSGPGGRIVAADVENAEKFGMASGGGGALPFVPQDGPAPGSEETVPLSGMRRVIAQRLVESKTTLPHFYLTTEVDAGPLMKTRSELKAAGEDYGFEKVTVNDFILRAMAVAAKKVPMVNASFSEDGIVQYGSVHLSVAVAVDDGLVTPVIRDAQAKGIRELSAEMKELAEKARSKKLKPEEYQGGTITLSNLGAYGIDHFYAIINPPQAAILSIGAIVRKPVVNPDTGAIEAGQRMSIGLSGDHRVVDGAVGAAFLAEMRRLIETPGLLLV